MFAEHAELEELVSVASEFNGIYATHLRSEGDQLEEAVQEALALAGKTGSSLLISHLKTYGKRNWGKLPSVLLLIEEARKTGLSVHADRYPYTASSTDLDVLLPPWAHDGGAEETLTRLEDQDIRDRMTQEILAQEPEPEFWESVIITSVAHEENREWEGKTLAAIAGQAMSAPCEVLYEILTKERLQVGAIFSLMSEDNLRRILAQEYVMIGSDSAARSTSGILRKGKPHPRGFGTFPRVLRGVRSQETLMDLEEAVHKMTGMPAEKLGLHDRGLINPGYFADLVIFDPSIVKDRADYGDPYQHPVGINYVIINGIEVVSGGEVTGKRPGKVLRKADQASSKGRGAHES
jgi:N-acyl-D-aspartate/D-glutamate deacylase